MFKKGRGKFGEKKDEGKDAVSAEDGKKGDEASAPTGSSALIRIQKDFQDLEIPDYVKMEVNKDDLFNFQFEIKPKEGLWAGGNFTFKFVLPPKYPFEGPKVTCVDKIYHPNIDLDGGVCVSVLRPWKPTYSIQIVLFGLLFLFSHPNPHDPLNNEAAADMRKDPTGFAKNVLKALSGQAVNGVSFPKNKGTGFKVVNSYY